MPEGEVIAFHGWGFDSSCWQGWKSRFTGMDFQAFERGYFGKEPCSPTFSDKNCPKIILTHSFGLHQCNDSLLNKADLLVIFGGFLSFHLKDERHEKRSKQMISRMAEKLQDRPEQVLNDFYKNVFYPGTHHQLPFISDTQLLIEDLNRLNTEKIDANKLKKGHKMCILHGFNDRIVPCSKGQDLFNVCYPHAKYLEVKHTGHALPFTHSGRCWSFIKPEIDELITSA